MDAFAKETRKCFTSILSDLGLEVDTAAKKRRQIFEKKYDHEQKKSSVQALKKWKQERQQYLLNEFHKSEVYRLDEITANLHEHNGVFSGDLKTSTAAQMMGSMYQSTYNWEISRRSGKRNERFSTSDAYSKPVTVTGNKSMKTSVSFDDAVHLQSNSSLGVRVKSCERSACSGDHESPNELQKLNKHWKKLKENVLSNIPKRHKNDGSLDSHNGQSEINDMNACQKMKQNFSKAVTEIGRLRRKSVDVFSNVKEMYQSLCNVSGLSENSSASYAKSNMTENTDLSDFSFKRRNLMMEDVPVFPFCAEYDGYSVRRTKTISESIQAVLNERKQQEEALLRDEIERQVTKILTMRMHNKSFIPNGDKIPKENDNYTDEITIKGIDENENDVREDIEIYKSNIDNSTNISEIPDDLTSTAYLDIDIEHSIYTNELKITIFSIKNLYLLTDTWRDMSVFITASPMPCEGLRRQKTKTREGHDEVEFHDDLYMGIYKDQTAKFAIRFRLYSKGNLLACKRNRCIGEALIWLDDINLKENTNMQVEMLSY